MMAQQGGAGQVRLENRVHESMNTVQGNGQGPALFSFPRAPVAGIHDMDLRVHRKRTRRASRLHRMRRRRSDARC